MFRRNERITDSGGGSQMSIGHRVFPAKFTDLKKPPNVILSPSTMELLKR